ncbi:GMC family oxidoreductase N-terminal domain-containing protein, partial [Pseudomonas viridiflava]|uniref:GMC family oxidoreductase N-terminal domain-containing protein n=1 Tax=Pseudomonas viridiflava TaxID=33069 RepID=UPI00197E88A9
GFMQHNIQDGQRMSTYRAFIEPVIDRSNLTVRTGCELQRVLFQGRTAVGVEVLKSVRLERIYAEREVILSAGSLKTPQMLMLSGVGPRAELEKHAIPVVLDSPGVGQNLQDHFYIHTG